MIDPWLAIAALGVSLAGAPVMADRDPGPNAACPDSMRLVEGTHYDSMYHVCLDPRKAHKTTHCYGYAQGISMLEGPRTPVRVCMDQFEAPNRRGVRPMVMQSYNSAKRWCERRGKRLCGEREWELACEGEQHLPLAYGWAVNAKLCNSNKGWKPVDFEAFGGDRETALAESNRLWQGSVSGRFQTCVSPFGIYDMMGNVEEWVAFKPVAAGSRRPRVKPGALMGGFWAKRWTGCRGTNDAHYPHFAFYETGFRCCKDPEE